MNNQTQENESLWIYLNPDIDIVRISDYKKGEHHLITRDGEYLEKLKLSLAQREILVLMMNDWELGQDLSLYGRHWIQKGGLGRSGESKTVQSRTVNVLYRLNLIKTAERKFPVQHYDITEKGKLILGSEK